jgi:hypothetical protein
MQVDGKPFRTLWPKEERSAVLQVIDQRQLPHEFVIEDLPTLEATARAISEMHVRGAGLIGATAAYGMYQALCEGRDLAAAGDFLQQTRPTAVNLRWAVNRMGIASEHMATNVLRSMLGSALTPTTASRLGPTILFATPTGERHELGLQSAALTAMGAGANPIYLGAELPVEDLVGAVANTGAVVLALSLVTIPESEAERAVAAIRGGLPDEIGLWTGGPAANNIAVIDGVDRIDSLDDLEKRVVLLGFERPGVL